MNETEQLSEYVAGLRYEDLPPEAVENAKLAILDAVGVALFGSRLPWSRIVADVGAALGSQGEATILGSDRSAAAPVAALVNGTAAHAVEMDDRRQGLELHNGASTVPASLGTAEDAGASARDLILAVVVGYEVSFRITRAGHGRTAGFYPSTWTTLGAAAAAAKALGLDKAGMMNALGVAGSMSSGISEFLHDPTGTMIKRVQGGGWPAHAGVMAALLAQGGLTGPRSVLEGQSGVLRSFCNRGEPDLEALTRNLGGRLEITEFQAKAYAAWGGSHCTLEGVLGLRKEHGLVADDVRRVRVGISTKIFAKSKRIPISSPLAAQHNLPFLVATALYHDLRDPSTWTDDIVEDTHITAALDRVHVEVDPEIESIFQLGQDDEGGAKVALDLDDGRTVETWVRFAKGNPGNLMTAMDVREKFRLMAGYVLPSAQLERLERYLVELEDQSAPVSLRPMTVVTS